MKGLTSRTANKTRSSNSNPAIAHENRLHHARPHPHKPSLTNSTGSAHSGAITAHKLTGTVRPGSSGGNSRGFLLMPAPMEDVTERAFRALTYKCGADVTFTEMSRLDSLEKNNKSSWKKVECDDVTPTVIQLLAAHEDKLVSFLKQFKPTPAFKGFNLNLGCPSPLVIKIGQGCAMVKRVAKTQRLVNIIRDRGHAVSIKMRLGMNEYEAKNKAYLNMIQQLTGVDYFIIHARHGKHTYADVAQHDVYEECVQTGKVIIANGDIHTVDQIAHLKRVGVAGAMIGRAAVKNPGIFNELKNSLQQQEQHEQQQQQSVETLSADSLKLQYMQYAKQFETPQKYTENVLTRIGKPFVANPGMAQG